MFEFNREFIINSNNGPLTNGKRFQMDGNVLKVGKMINIEAGKVRSIHCAEYVPEVSEVLELDVTGLDGTLTVSIGQEGRVISLVSDRLAHHTKDYIFNGVPTQWAAQFERQAAMEDMDRLIDIELTSNVLKVSAKDCYTRIVKVSYEGKAVNGVYHPKVEWVRDVEAKNAAGLLPSSTQGITKVSFTPGTEGMGTVTRILKNMRLQTAAHLSAHGFDMDERPLPGGKYDQYTIQYVSERLHQSGEVFGSINHSLVTLIFFVEKSLCAGTTGDWLDCMQALAGKAGTNVCTILKAKGGKALPYVDSDADGVVTPAEVESNGAIEAKEPIVTEAKKHKA